MIRRILVGIGETDYTISAIRQAVELAMVHGAELTAVSVLDENRLARVGPVPIGAGSFAHDLAASRMANARERSEWGAQEFTAACSDAGVKYQIARKFGDPFDVLTHQSHYHDLMIFGLKSLFEFDLVDDPHDVLVRLVQFGVRPILAVCKGYYQVRKVLIAYSGSAESAHAMKNFAQMRLWQNPLVRIVSFTAGRMLDETKELLGEASLYCRAHGYEVETDAVHALPKDQIVPYAEEWGADLIVVGNSAKSLLLRRIFGETALQVVRHATRPLFLSQ